MPLPDYIQEYSRTDNYTVVVTIRISQAQAQLIADLQGEWGLSDRSITIRSVLDGFSVLAKEREERENAGDISPQTLNWIKYQQAKGALETRKRINEELYQSYVLAMTTDDIATRNNLLESCECIAQDHGIEWPPADLPLAIRNPDAIKVREAAFSIMRDNNTNRASRREIMRITGLPLEKVEPAIDDLVQAGQVEKEEEPRSGRPTEWVMVPSINFAAED